VNDSRNGANDTANRGSSIRGSIRGSSIQGRPHHSGVTLVDAVRMQKGCTGQLNPAHSRWLMGYPAEWDSCGATAMQSCRKSPRRSSKRT
jgi:hypothetical protein